MARNQVIVLKDVSEEVYAPPHRIHFQWCRFVIETGIEYGYRFMWTRNGKLLPLRGGARLPNAEIIKRLMAQADKEGWGNKDENSGP